VNRHQLVTVVLFSLLIWGAYRLSRRLEPELPRLAVIMARTPLFLVNSGFWVSGEAPSRSKYWV
jgi:hypothetical protein